VLPSVAGATIMVPLSVEQMTREADVVVHGRVVTQQAVWDDKHDRIYTHTTLEVIEPIHSAGASPPGKVLVRSLGGELDGVGLAVSGTPKFAIGEEAVLFLRRDPKIEGAYQVIGMNQGKFRIEREPGTNKVTAVANPEGIAFAKPGVDGVLRVDPATPRIERIPLEDFRRRIRGSVGLKEAAPGR
jgi:hypothetical protein